MLVGFTCQIDRPRQSIDCAEVDSSTMPHGKHDPSPENFVAEVNSLLASCINLRILVSVLVVHILFDRVSEQTLPTCPKSIVEQR